MNREVLTSRTAQKSADLAIKILRDKQPQYLHDIKVRETPNFF